MATTEYAYLSALREFLLSYPYGAPYNRILIDHIKIMELKNSDRDEEGAALVPAGDNIVNRNTTRNVMGELIDPRLRKRINFSLMMWRATNDDEFRRDISNFLNHFINWINEENNKRGTPEENPLLPIFSNIDIEKEIISASGGIQTGEVTNTRSVFSIGIHIDYTMIYK